MDILTKHLDTQYTLHPFEQIPMEADYKFLMRNYLAMSQAFPHLQAGSQKEYIFHCINNNIDVDVSFEITSVVGNFLCWDETGGFYPTLAQGLKALPRILETRRFHANILREDCKKLFGETITPDYSALTKEYLHTLYEGLAAYNHAQRLAFMTSFETHAHVMIDALWRSLIKKFEIQDANTLSYFQMHVGGSDPAEFYHVDMTRRMIEAIVDKEKLSDFIALYNQAYGHHHHWCQKLVHQSHQHPTMHSELTLKAS